MQIFCGIVELSETLKSPKTITNKSSDKNQLNVRKKKDVFDYLPEA